MRSFFLLLFLLQFFFPLHAQRKSSYHIMVYEQMAYRRGAEPVMIINHYVLYADGRIYKSFVTGLSPEQINRAGSKGDGAELWGNWEEQATGMLINWPDARSKTETWKRGLYYKVLPASPNDRLHGKYRILSASKGTGAVGLDQAQTIDFKNDGSFSASFAALSGQTRRRVILGTYLLNGYSVTFRYPGGKPQTFCFYFMPAKKGGDAREENSTTIGLGKAYYVKTP
ncbi:hypothetical protein [Pedobacter sp. SYP-B3415]|uniref:hypothetical protein n=1 Tax=Pedobacter sp. SYP-B3415 TaxID=2496641 RepID=UPI00101CB78E|nr:hypothetical protein [Pedobacter sp. SYP-B3415]